MSEKYGRYLDVDLSSGKAHDYEIAPEWQEAHLGGRGIAARIILEEIAGPISALSPDNILVFATGPFQGTGLAGAGRHVVMGVSPKTGSVGGSYVGGYFAHELGTSGYDGILLRGKSADPVTVALIDGKLELRSAADLWGKGTGETETILRNRYPNSRVASIGIAGEKLVRMSCIIHDRAHAAGRLGLGAVMGSKGVKAVVVQGGREKPLYDPEQFKKQRVAYARDLMTDDKKRFGEVGTPSVVVPYNVMGILPTKNFQEGVFEGAEAIGGEQLRDEILVGRGSCSGCPIRCKRVVKTSFAGREVIPAYGGPEYETIAALGSLCLNDNIHAIALANQLCNEYGLDTISVGITIAFLMEASEKKKIPNVIKWGDAEAIINLVEQIAHKQGMGETLADGLEAFARNLGVDFHMMIKGVEVPMHDPRGKKGLGLSYATSPRGATHLEGVHDHVLEIDSPSSDIGITRAYDRVSLEDKPAIVKTYEDLWSFTDSLILCIFTVNAVGPDYSYGRVRSLLESAVGISLSAEDMLKIGERNYALLRLCAARAGYTTEDDVLPSRFSTPLPRGGTAGQAISPEEMDTAIKAYYEERGYDGVTPTRDTLYRLGLEQFAGSGDL